MGAPRRPFQLKAIAGTVRKDRIEKVVEQDVSAISEKALKPPSWLPNVHAKNEWLRLIPVLMKSGLLQEGTMSPLGVMCALYGKIVQVYAAGGEPALSLLITYRTMAKDFGLTQGKCTTGAPAAGNDQKNPFTRNGRKF